jgi:iron-sulfur cluster repair protein YtfE (RIC family)
MISMKTQRQPIIAAFLEHEHEELFAGIDRIHELADELCGMPVDRISPRVARVLRWVDETLKPHMAWEESWLFPQVDDRARTPWVTRLVRFDHRQIAQQVECLKTHQSKLDHGSAHEMVVRVSGDLLGLETLLRANLEREDHFLMPLLEGEVDRWTPEWRD